MDGFVGSLLRLSSDEKGGDDENLFLFMSFVPTHSREYVNSDEGSGGPPPLPPP